MKRFQCNTLFLLCIPVGMLPIFFSRHTIDPCLHPRFMLLAVFLFVMAATVIVRQFTTNNVDHLHIRLSMLHFSVFGYGLFSLLSIFVAGNRSESLFEAAKVVLFSIYFITVVPLIGRSDKGRSLLGKTVIVVAFLIALAGILEYWHVFQLLDCERAPASTMGNRNLLSSYLFLCSGFVLYGVLNCRGLWYYLSVLSITAMAYVFIITQTRAVWVACVIGAAVTGGVTTGLIPDRTIKFLRTRWQRLLSLVIIISTLLVFHHQFTPAGDQREQIGERAISVFDKELGSNIGRLHLWKKTGGMIRDNFFLGVGTGNWKIIMPKYGIGDLPSPFMVRILVRPHNDFLWVFAEAGIFGFLSFCGIFLFGFYYSLRMIIRRDSERDRVLASCLIFVITGYAVISFFDFPKERIAHQVMWATILALVISLHNPSAVQLKISKKMVIALNSLVLLFSTICLLFGAIRTNSDKYMIKVLNFRKSSEWSYAIDESDRIPSFLYTMDHTSTPVSWYRGIANYSLNRYEEALKDFKKASSIHPNHIHVLNNLGSCHETLKNHSAAEKAYLKALAISPGFDEVLVNLAAVYYNTGEYNKAYEMIKKCSVGGDWRRETYIKKIEEKLSNK